jgi:hypothetical protein
VVVPFAVPFAVSFAVPWPDPGFPRGGANMVFFFRVRAVTVCAGG